MNWHNNFAERFEHRPGVCFILGNGQVDLNSATSGAPRGGGSNGKTNASGSGVNAGNNGDTDYASNAGKGGTGGASGADGSDGNAGRVVLIW
ncbi:MAG TPA: hypothetical protein VHA35_12695 [Dongiaceae bacterium]|nr:hypothetical protein [Dongiaceae bacterium]